MSRGITKRNWTVIYRTGGTANYEWHAILEVGTYAEMLTHRDEIRRAGRSAFVHPIGAELPTTYEFHGKEPREFVAVHAGRIYVSDVKRQRGGRQRITGLGYSNDLGDAVRLSYIEMREIAHYANGRNYARQFVVEPLIDAHKRFYAPKPEEDTNVDA